MLVAFHTASFARTSWHHTAGKEALQPLAMTTLYAWHVDKTRRIASAHERIRQKHAGLKQNNILRFWNRFPQALCNKLV